MKKSIPIKSESKVKLKIKKFKICLLGSLPKGDEVRKNWKDWKTEYKEKLSAIPNVEFADGDVWRNESELFLTFGHDCYVIKESDLVIVDACQKLGAGTAQEILIAKYFKKPVVTVLPKDTHHRRSNVIFDGKLIKDWIHPFIFSTSDLIVEKIEDSVKFIIKYKNDKKLMKIKSIRVINNAVRSYINFNKSHSELVSESIELKSKLS